MYGLYMNNHVSWILLILLAKVHWKICQMNQKNLLKFYILTSTTIIERVSLLQYSSNYMSIAKLMFALVFGPP